MPLYGFMQRFFSPEGAKHLLQQYKQEGIQANQLFRLRSNNSPVHSSMFRRTSKSSKGDDHPAGAPPSYEASASSGNVPQHDWQSAVPDTSLLPPPPSLGFQASPVYNATEADAMRGKNWCLAHPLQKPTPLSSTHLQRLDNGDLQLLSPASFQGSVSARRSGVTQVRSRQSSPDTCLTSSLPLYVVDAHSPFFLPSLTKTIYYEVRVFGSRDQTMNISLGYVAPPYPVFRLPGWHRGSLGVHGDDGHRYINDMWGGREFTSPFVAGQTVGLGMTFTVKPDATSYKPSSWEELTRGGQVGVEVFFTRNGAVEGRWNIHEEGDAQEDLPVTGLEGGHDLYAAVGCFEEAEFEVVFRREEWLFKPGF